jgi:hypothetical protein
MRACKQICLERQTGVPADGSGLLEGALAWGARGPGFKSRRPDQKFSNTYSRNVCCQMRFGVQLESKNGAAADSLGFTDTWVA